MLEPVCVTVIKTELVETSNRNIIIFLGAYDEGQMSTEDTYYFFVSIFF
jgi:hypothetical protein